MTGFVLIGMAMIPNYNNDASEVNQHENIMHYEFISGPFDGWRFSRDHGGIVMGAEIIKTIISACGKSINLKGNMIMPGQLRIKFNNKYANYGYVDSRTRKYVFEGYV